MNAAGQAPGWVRGALALLTCSDVIAGGQPESADPAAREVWSRRARRFEAEEKSREAYLEAGPFDTSPRLILPAVKDGWLGFSPGSACRDPAEPADEPSRTG